MEKGDDARERERERMRRRGKEQGAGSEEVKRQKNETWPLKGQQNKWRVLALTQTVCDGLQK